MKQKTKLWTKDFSCITAATVLSAIGGEAMNLPVSLLVFDETQSAFLSAVIMVCGMLPDVLLPVLAAPLIDKGGKKKWIVGMDALLAVLYVVMGVWISKNSFSFGVYVAFTLLAGTISVFYRLAYQAWYPDLIPAGEKQKGYAVSAMVYPIVLVVSAPFATFLYETLKMNVIFYVVAGITVASIMVESRVTEKQSAAEESYTFRQYRRDIAEGFTYIKEEKGIRNIYTYMAITQGTSEGLGIITQVYYQSQPWLTVTMLGFLKSAEMIGRVLGGFFQYTKEIPAKKRYAFTKFVYIFYNIIDMVLLFLPYPAMLASRFLCGGLGISSATVRETAVMSYLPEQMRARVNAFFNTLFAIGGVLFQFLAGALGEILPYRAAALLLGGASLVSVFFLIVLPAKDNRPVYEAGRR